jgi:hypothetical protein
MWDEYVGDSFSCNVSTFYNLDSCFPPDTPVLTPDRGWIPITKIGVGDKVVSFDANGHRKTAEVKGLQVTDNRKLRFVNGVRISMWQKVQLFDRTYKTVEDLKIGDVLIDTDGKPQTIASLEDVAGTHTVHNLIFESRDTPFSAAGFRVKDWKK